MNWDIIAHQTYDGLFNAGIVIISFIAGKAYVSTVREGKPKKANFFNILYIYVCFLLICIITTILICNKLSINHKISNCLIVIIPGAFGVFLALYHDGRIRDDEREQISIDVAVKKYNKRHLL